MYIGGFDDQGPIFYWPDSPLKPIFSYLHLSMVRAIRRKASPVSTHVRKNKEIIVLKRGSLNP